MKKMKKIKTDAFYTKENLFYGKLVHHWFGQKTLESFVLSIISLLQLIAIFIMKPVIAVSPLGDLLLVKGIVVFSAISVLMLPITLHLNSKFCSQLVDQINGSEKEPSNIGHIDYIHWNTTLISFVLFIFIFLKF